MRRQIILHIGLHKTGTSSLQRAFASHAGSLQSRGIAYVLPSGVRGFAHHDLAASVAAGNLSVFDEYFGQTRDKWEGSERILISSERMATLSVEQLERLKACLDRQFDDPTYVVWLFVRRPSAHIPSRWHSFIRHGGVDNLPAFAFAAVNGILQSNRFAFEGVSDRWASVFGVYSLRVRSMEKLIAGDGNFVSAAFQAMLGTEFDSLRNVEVRNAALPPGAAELVRLTSMRRQLEAPDGVRNFIRPMIALLRREDNSLRDIARTFDPLIDYITIADRSEAFLAIERATVERLGDRLDGWGDGTMFGPQEPASAPYVRNEGWFNLAMQRRLDEAYALAARLPRRDREGKLGEPRR